MNNLLLEGGFRDIKKISQTYDKAEIYFHQDLDGVTTAIAMKNYLERNGISVIDAHIIQYGTKEFAVKKIDLEKQYSISVQEFLNKKLRLNLNLNGDLQDEPTTNAVMEYQKLVNIEKTGYWGDDVVMSMPESDRKKLREIVKKNCVVPVLVDFAHGKPMFVIHTDHHLSQIGVDKGTSTQFRGARSNVETISQVVSKSDIFPTDDIHLISTVDSANFASQGITFDEVINYIYKLDKDTSVRKNKMLLGFVVNKLLLAFKNKKGFLESLVMDSNPNLFSIYRNIRNWMEENNAPSLENLQAASSKYREKMKSYEKQSVGNKIIFQVGAGSMKTGEYDRYTAFRNNPNEEFLIMVWDTIGMIQASKNPFKKNEHLKHIDLDKMNKDILSEYENMLKDIELPLSFIKRISEKETVEGSVGFTFKDFIAIYGDKFRQYKGGKKALEIIENIMEKPYSTLSFKQKDFISNVTITAWDYILRNSGGHKDITNISGLTCVLGDEKDRYDWVKYKELAMEIANTFKSRLVEKLN